MQLVSIYWRHFKLQCSSSVLLVVRCTVMHSDPTVHGDIFFTVFYTDRDLLISQTQLHSS